MCLVRFLLERHRLKLRFFVFIQNYYCNQQISCFDFAIDPERVMVTARSAFQNSFPFIAFSKFAVCFKDIPSI